MGKFGEILKGVLPAGVSAVAGLLGQLFTNRSSRREYDKMRAYNTPAAQMQRFREAGLSPYLAYGQASSGNVSAPAPAQETGLENVGKGIDNYMSWANFDVDQKNKWMQYWNMQNENKIGFYNAEVKSLERDKKQLELYSDYPDLIGDVSIDVANTGYRRKLLELKRSASEAMIDRVRTSVENLHLKNAVDRVKAKYATDYGMVGGDWTQGLGLIKSLPSLFKGSRKVVGGKSLPPWQSTIRTNPVVPMRVRRRRPSPGVVNP